MMMKLRETYTSIIADTVLLNQIYLQGDIPHILYVCDIRPEQYVDGGENIRIGVPFFHHALTARTAAHHHSVRRGGRCPALPTLLGGSGSRL